MTRGRVLVAEGSVFMRIMLTTTLERFGFEVVATANNGKEAVDGYMELRPDIVLVDVELKDMDAIEITRVIANEDPSAVVIILIPESMDVPDIIVDAVRAGAKGYMRKPISAEEIEAHIRSAMRRR